MSTATTGQIRYIHTLAIGKLKLEDDVYRGVLGAFGVESSKDLSSDHARELISSLKRMANVTDKWKAGNSGKYDDLKNRERNMATPKQLRMIAGMWADVSNKNTPEEREKALRGFLFRIVKVGDLSFLKRYQVQKVVEALKAMKYIEG